MGLLEKIASDKSKYAACDSDNNKQNHMLLQFIWIVIGDVIDNTAKDCSVYRKQAW